jgi:hypothetical protein
MVKKALHNNYVKTAIAAFIQMQHKDFYRRDAELTRSDAEAFSALLSVNSLRLGGDVLHLVENRSSCCAIIIISISIFLRIC